MSNRRNDARRRHQVAAKRVHTARRRSVQAMAIAKEVWRTEAPPELTAAVVEVEQWMTPAEIAAYCDPALTVDEIRERPTPETVAWQRYSAQREAWLATRGILGDSVGTEVLPLVESVVWRGRPRAWGGIS